ncbi:MAG: 2-oxoglutarate dehydrogenase E1 component [Alphaproteobacteria bacterium]
MRQSIDILSFLYAGNGTYLADMYRQFIEQPDSCPEEWRAAFIELGLDARTSDLPSPGFGTKRAVTQGATSSQSIIDSVRALMMIRAYRVRGHLIAQLDPLRQAEPPSHPDLELSTYGFGPQDMDREIYLDGYLGFTTASLRQIVEHLRQTYCHTVGVEFMHIQDPLQRSWIQDRFEQARSTFSNAQQKELLLHLLKAETFERFLQVKFPGAKRFGLEGAESLIPALEMLLAKLSQRGVKAVTIGTAHRGRLNILANILHKPLPKIFAQFKGVVASTGDRYGSGDVKYHMGYSSDRAFAEHISESHDFARTTSSFIGAHVCQDTRSEDSLAFASRKIMRNEHSLHISMVSNPSHLESVNPVVLGKVRAKQALYGDTNRQQFMGLLLHGDAAFAGQGLVAETLAMSALRGFRTGGTLHIIINNQIGFTTSPPHSRASPYSSDVAKIIQAPIIHVNGDDLEAVVWATLVAEDFRYQFAQDIVVDMICYRRHGHNESDEPSFTQPLMYQAIAKQETVLSLYRRTLLEAAILTEDEMDAMAEEVSEHLHTEFAKAITPEELHPLQGAWSTIKVTAPIFAPILTGVDRKTLQDIGHAVFQVTDGFALHPKIAHQFELKKKTLDSGENIDWATAEILAFGSLLSEKTPIRFSGQDVRRGTFSQRHAVLIDQKTEEQYIPLARLADAAQTVFEIVDSPLAEASVLGSEYGYSTTSPNGLVIWEAQFGDFANGAQVIIDQFIASGEAKWMRLSGLVLLLPHGFEGQGPEHSSARLERFLQLCAEDNICVVNCSTPANYFHALRRQVRNDYRKPLILLTPKSLLRNHQAVSNLDEMSEGSTFQAVITDAKAAADPVNVTRVVLCNGKLYYDLLLEREKRGAHTVALIRIEQFYPFPTQELKDCLAPFKQQEVIWCQEEPLNMGAWTFIDRRMEKLLKGIGGQSHQWRGVGRPPAAAPATGLLERHIAEQNKIIDEALS